MKQVPQIEFFFSIFLRAHEKSLRINYNRSKTLVTIIVLTRLKEKK